jgi:hypothetical protein
MKPMYLNRVENNPEARGAPPSLDLGARRSEPHGDCATLYLSLTPVPSASAPRQCCQTTWMPG